MVDTHNHILDKLNKFVVKNLINWKSQYPEAYRNLPKYIWAHLLNVWKALTLTAITLFYC